MKAFFMRVRAWLKKYFHNPKWRCLSCGKEIFEGDFCLECKEKLPFNNRAICNHCGRQTLAGVGYCSTCKGELVSIDKCRSVFNYDLPISALIKRLKYDNRRYVAEIFAKYLSNAYFKNYFNADFLTYVPMTKRAERKRGYNQGRLLAEETSKIVGVSVVECVAKVKETKRQVKLKRIERLKNLENAFKVIDRKIVKDKVIVVIDDVTTTGATAEAIAKKLKSAGAKMVYLLTIASVPSKEKY